MKRAAESPPDQNRAGVVKKILGGTFGGRVADRDHAIAAFNAHIAAVKNAINSDRLLVFEVADGSEPLCAFLDVDVPDAAFPRTNGTDEFGDIFPALIKGCHRP